MYVRALHADDDRNAFRSGDADLDRYFHKYAGQNQFRHHLGTTYVAVEDQRILGFVTVSPGQLESESLSTSLSRRLPRYPLPILRLARLAVDASYRNRGIGKDLLRAVFELALRMAADYGCVGIAVDANPEAIAFYAKFGFTPKTAVAGEQHASPKPVPMFLPISKLRRSFK